MRARRPAACLRDDGFEEMNCKQILTQITGRTAARPYKPKQFHPPPEVFKKVAIRT